MNNSIKKYLFTMLANGIDLEMVQKILGHTDIRTTQIYADVLQENIETRYLRIL